MNRESGNIMICIVVNLFLCYGEFRLTMMLLPVMLLPMMLMLLFVMLLSVMLLSVDLMENTENIDNH